MTIGALARAAGVNVQTVRFYERKGLIAPEGRTAAGYRQYAAGAVRRIGFIKHAKEIGFSLREIAELLALRVDPARTCADVRARAAEKKDEVARKIERLQQMQRALARLMAQCEGRGPVSACPIIEALDEVNQP